MFNNRLGHKVVLKRSLGGETIIKFVNKTSEYRLKREIKRIYAKQDKKRIKELSQPFNTEGSDEFFEQWKANNENNLIELGEK